MNSGVIFDIRKFSLHDGPGLRTAVFFKGCPLSCPWCHNPEGRDGKPALLRRPGRCVHCNECTIYCPLALEPKKAAGSASCAECDAFGACAEVCPAEAIQEVGRRLSSGEIMATIREDLAFYEESGGGVTFTGGEPLAQAPLLVELLEVCRSEGIHSAIETSGYARREVFLDVARRADLLLFDLKHAEAARGSELTGVDYSICLGNLEAAARESARGGFAKIIVRMPIIPGMNDGERDLEAAARLISGLAVPDLPVHLLPYHEAARGKYVLWGLDYPLSETKAPSEAAMDAARALFAAQGTAVRIGG